jgi:hypothetical protein
VLDREDETGLVIESDENRDLTAADLARDKRINKKGDSTDTI